jgi:hypothetical protein
VDVYYRVRNPPLMKIVCAVIQPASGEARNFAKGTMSFI